MKTLLLFASLLTANFAHAQGGSMGGGGGNITESDLRHYIGKISTYLKSAEGKAAFPEIVSYDEAHPEQSFTAMIETVNPVVKKEVQKDAFGIARTCVSYTQPNRYFVCNSDELPNNELNNQSSVYRIVFHELLVQAGIEKPLSVDVPSEYKISWRITDNVHLETYQEWVPGKGDSTSLQDPDTLFKCFNSNYGKEIRGVIKKRRNGEPYMVLEIEDPGLNAGFNIQSESIRNISSTEDAYTFEGTTQMGDRLFTDEAAPFSVQIDLPNVWNPRLYEQTTGSISFSTNGKKKDLKLVCSINTSVLKKQPEIK